MIFLIAVLCSFTLSLLAVPVCRAWAIRNGYVDHPDGARKRHAKAIPRIGGMAVFVSFLGGIALCLACGVWGPKFPPWPGMAHVLRILPAVCIVFATGLIDDLIHLKPWQKIAGQLLASGLAIVGGVQIGAPGGVRFLAIAGTIVWLVVCANAFNLIDGIDGLAAGIGLFASSALAIIGLVTGQRDLALIAVILFGALLGFLKSNFHPASIFLGDCGSMTAGFLLACFAVMQSQMAPTRTMLCAVFLPLSLPLLDTVLAILRRAIRGQSLFAGDRRHVHHILLNHGMSLRQTVFILYGFSAISLGVSIALVVAPVPLQRIAMAMYVIAVLGGLRYLRYTEFRLAAEMFLGGRVHRIIQAKLALEEVGERLSKETSLVDALSFVGRVAPQYGFHLSYSNDLFSSGTISTPEPAARSGWSIAICVARELTVYLHRDSQLLQESAIDDMFPELIRNSLQALIAKTPAWRLESGREKELNREFIASTAT